MIAILNKLYPNSKNFSSLNLKFKKIKEKTEIEKIFKAVEQFSDTSEIRYVGGCVRKILYSEEVDDIDLAVNLSPDQVSENCSTALNIFSILVFSLIFLNFKFKELKFFEFG